MFISRVFINKLKTKTMRGGINVVIPQVEVDGTIQLLITNKLPLNTQEFSLSAKTGPKLILYNSKRFTVFRSFSYIYVLFAFAKLHSIGSQRNAIVVF